MIIILLRKIILINESFDSKTKNQNPFVKKMINEILFVYIEVCQRLKEKLEYYDQAYEMYVDEIKNTLDDLFGNITKNLCHNIVPLILDCHSDKITILIIELGSQNLDKLLELGGHITTIYTNQCRM